MAVNFLKVNAMSLEELNPLLDEINNDRSVPRNIRNIINEAKNSLNDEKQEMDVRINTAISLLEEISNDPNIPIYTRTQIWNIVSMLEVMNEQRKIGKDL